MIKYDYTFKEILDDKDQSDNKPWNMSLTFYQLFGTNYINAPLWDNGASKAYLEDLWKILFARFWNWYCIRSEADGIDDVSTLDIIELESKIINVIILTYDKYSALLNGFAGIKSSLMAQVSASTETGYNDTPQSEGGYTDDPYRTSYTKVTSKTDGATPIARLKEVQDKIRNLFLEWTDEFKVLFWPE